MSLSLLKKFICGLAFRVLLFFVCLVCVAHTISRLDCLMKIVGGRRYSLITSVEGEIEIVTDIKAEISVNKAERSSDIEKYCELAHGQVIIVNNERFTCPEVLLKSTLIGKKSQRIHKLTYIDIERDLYTNTVLFGGTAMLPTINVRLTKEMTSLASESIKVKIVAPPRNVDYKIKDEYDESNPDTLKKFFKLLQKNDEYDIDNHECQ